jgi:hypothetical protein
MTLPQNRRIGVVAIIIQDQNDAYKIINEILHDYSSIIIGRLGLPTGNATFPSFHSLSMAIRIRLAL